MSEGMELKKNFVGCGVHGKKQERVNRFSILYED
jgi:hypothetical protein